jgi:hypothetical protein
MTGTHPNRVPRWSLTSAVAVAAAPVLCVACIDPPAQRGSQPEPEPARQVDTVLVDRVVVDTVTVSNPETERQVARLQMQLLEKDAQISRLQTQIEETTREVVRSMARQQTVASRAEAASAMAEAEVALEQLKTAAGGRETQEIRQIQGLLESSTAEFNQENYGGSLYLANQAKSLAGADRGRLLRGTQGSLRPGETLFTVSLPLRTVRRSNVREGPGTEFPVTFTLEPGATLVGHSYVGQWLRVSTPDGQTGWVFQNLVESRGVRN